nr:MAG TPA: OB4 dimerization domain protein [Caudoviricetes sp.]
MTARLVVWCPVLSMRHHTALSHATRAVTE